MLAVPETLWAYLQARSLRPFVAVDLDPVQGLAREVVTDGGIEAWASATNATSWTETIAEGTVNREASAHRSGTYCARLDRTSAGTATGVMLDQSGLVLRPGRWYALEVWHKGSVAGAGARVILLNASSGEYLEGDGSWGVGATATILSNVATTWKRSVLWFQAKATARWADTHAIYLQHNGANGTSVYYDDISIRGPFDRRGLYYSSQAATWQGVSYSALVEEVSTSKESMDLIVPEVSVTFSNVGSALRSYFTPTDLITGSRLVLRLLMRDSGGTILDDSLVLFAGRVRRPRKITQTSIELEARGLIDGLGQKFPRRRCAQMCPWAFADAGRYSGAGHCSYALTTTLTANSVAPYTSHQVASTALLVVNRTILDPSGNAVTIGSITDSTHFTTLTAAQFLNNDPVRYADCRRDPADCAKRDQEHRFAGFRAAEITGRMGARMRRNLPLEV